MDDQRQAVADRILPRHQRCSRRRAGRLDQKLRQPQPLAGQLVEARRRRAPQLSTAIGAEVAVPHVVGENEDDVGLLLLLGDARRCRSHQDECCQSESTHDWVPRYCWPARRGRRVPIGRLCAHVRSARICHNTLPRATSACGAMRTREFVGTRPSPPQGLAPLHQPAASCGSRAQAEATSPDHCAAIAGSAPWRSSPKGWMAVSACSRAAELMTMNSAQVVAPGSGSGESTDCAMVGAAAASASAPIIARAQNAPASQDAACVNWLGHAGSLPSDAAMAGTHRRVPARRASSALDHLDDEYVDLFLAFGGKLLVNCGGRQLQLLAIWLASTRSRRSSPSASRCPSACSRRMSPPSGRRPARRAGRRREGREGCLSSMRLLWDREQSDSLVTVACFVPPAWTVKSAMERGGTGGSAPRSRKPFVARSRRGRVELLQPNSGLPKALLPVQACSSGGAFLLPQALAKVGPRTYKRQLGVRGGGGFRHGTGAGDLPGRRRRGRAQVSRAGACHDGLPMRGARERRGFPRPARSRGPGLRVLDLGLPGMDGFAVQQELLAGRVERSVIFLTGIGDIPASVRAMKAGAVDFLTKPVEAQALLAAVEQAIARDFAARSTLAEATGPAKPRTADPPRARGARGHLGGSAEQANRLGARGRGENGKGASWPDDEEVGVP